MPTNTLATRDTQPLFALDQTTQMMRCCVSTVYILSWSLLPNKVQKARAREQARIRRPPARRYKTLSSTRARDSAVNSIFNSERPPSPPTTNTPNRITFTTHDKRSKLYIMVHPLHRADVPMRPRRMHGKLDSFDADANACRRCDAIVTARVLMSRVRI